MTRKDPLAAIRDLMGLRDTPAGRYAVEHLWMMKDGTVVCSPHWPERDTQVRYNTNTRTVMKPKSDLVLPLYSTGTAFVTVNPLNWLKTWCLDRAQFYAKVGPYKGYNAAERMDNSPPLALLVGHVNDIDWGSLDTPLAGADDVTTQMLAYSAEQYTKGIRSLVRISSSAELFPRRAQISC